MYIFIYNRRCFLIFKSNWLCSRATLSSSRTGGLSKRLAAGESRVLSVDLVVLVLAAPHVKAGARNYPLHLTFALILLQPASKCLRISYFLMPVLRSVWLFCGAQASWVERVKRNQVGTTSHAYSYQVSGHVNQLVPEHAQWCICTHIWSDRSKETWYGEKDTIPEPLE